jgi:hypothetical protein
MTRSPRSRSPLRPRRLAALLGVLALLALPAPAGAAPDLELSVMDDQMLLGSSQERVDAAMARFVSLGFDRLRVSAFWAHHAPRPTALRKPRFDATNPYDPGYDWTSLDRVVASAAQHGLKVMISISTPAPYWATSSPRKRNGVWQPRADELAAFSFAVAVRYAAFVDQYGLLNEPNQGAWLQPQSDRRGYVAPHLYRELARAMYPAVRTGDPSSTALLGELAPSGRDDRGTTRPIRPLAFLRAMACVNTRFRSVRSGRCQGFQPAAGDAIGHHPYSLFTAPTRASRERDDAAIGDTRRLLRTLDALTARGRVTNASRGRFDVYYTEFGYQTDPPDPFAGIPLRRQDRWLQDAGYVAWRTPRVKALNQFRLSDGAIRGRGPAAFNEFQSGLLFRGGRPKPSFHSFPHPIVLSRSGSRLRIWGHVRPGGAHRVTVERRTGRGRFRAIERVRTDERGFFALRVPARRGDYRYRHADGHLSGTSPTGTFGRR